MISTGKIKSSSIESASKEIREETIVVKLSSEQKSLLLMLLEQSGKSLPRNEVEQNYELLFDKTIADFNIVENQLKDLGLISVFRSSMRGDSWELTKKGLRVASILHGQIKS